jgi:hypothetical protein
MLYSNVIEDKKAMTTKIIPQAVVQKLTGERFFGAVRAIRVSLAAMEIQILKKMDAFSR